MIKHEYYCDTCGKRLTDGRETLNLISGREMDAAGSMESMWVSADLCAACLVVFIHFLVGKENVVDAGKSLEDFLSVKKPPKEASDAKK